MVLSGGGRQLAIPGKNVKVSAVLTLDRKNLSVQSSDSSFANAGAKPQKVQVSAQIPVEEVSKLSDLIELARACDADDEPIPYTVSDDLCSALGILQVIFSGELRVEEPDELQVFNLSFQLQEHQSVAERREERANANAAEQEAGGSGEIAVGTVDPAKINQIAKDSAAG